MKKKQSKKPKKKKKQNVKINKIEMEGYDILAKIYVKFYICQINSAVSFPIWFEVQKKRNNIIEKEMLQKEEDLMEIDDEPKGEMNEKYIRKLFVIGTKIYSKVEIMGIVIEIKTFHQEGERERKIILIDDTTGVIQCILWKNKMENIYNNSDKEIVPGTFLRILGQNDYFFNKFEINIERYQILTKYINEYLFHTTLLNNQKSIEKTKFEIDFEEEQKQNLTNQKEKINQSQLKDFANGLLAFFQNFTIEGTEDDKMGYTVIPIKNILSSYQIVQMIKDNFGQLNTEEQINALKNVFELFNQYMVGKILYENDSQDFINAKVEIKIDTTVIKKEIYNFILKKTEEDASIGANFQEIYKYICQIYSNFYNNDYLKFLLGQMIEKENKIMNLSKNTYITC